jgi:DNA-binding CsgD family transcriptional regulator
MGRWPSGLLAGVALVAAVTGIVALLDGHVPVHVLIVLYLLAVLPVATIWGFRLAAVTAVVSVAVFTLFLPPRGSVLSNREREVLALMAEGHSNAGVGRKLWVTEGTIEKHVHSILAKLGLPETDDHHRRVLAVLAFLEAR